VTPPGVILLLLENAMRTRKPAYFRNSLDLRDKVQVKVLRKRLKLSDEQFASVVRKSGNSIAAITKEATFTGTIEPVVTSDLFAF
jgi:hypothetical protein